MTIKFIAHSRINQDVGTKGISQNCHGHTSYVSSREGREQATSPFSHVMFTELSFICIIRVELRKYGFSLYFCHHQLFYLLIFTAIIECVLLADIVIGFQSQTGHFFCLTELTVSFRGQGFWHEYRNLISLDVAVVTQPLLWL